MKIGLHKENIHYKPLTGESKPNTSEKSANLGVDVSRHRQSDQCWFELNINSYLS